MYPGPNKTSQPSSDGNSQSGDDTHTLSPAHRMGAGGMGSWANTAPGKVTKVAIIHPLAWQPSIDLLPQ